MFQFSALPPLSLYVHFPWCVRKCPYCDFNSHEAKSTLDENAYVDALLVDLEQDLPAVWGRPVISIFFGGGTPSLFGAEAIDRLLSGLRARLPLVPEVEITLEANPGTVEYGRFAEYRAAGVNRLSIGVQSFQPHLLEALGRIHSAGEARNAAEAAREAGFQDFNLDLMFALPEQTLQEAGDDLEAALALEPTHLSYYQLTIEPNTLFHRRPPRLPEEDLAWAMQERAQARLAEAGYAQYEVSAYARPGRRSRHNLNYWRFGDYLGIGAGAHGKISDAREGRIVRTAKTRHPQTYLQKVGSGDPGLVTTRDLSREDVGFEFMLNALRLTGGFASSLFAEHTGLPILQVEAGLREAEARGWIEWDLHSIRPTEQGRRFLNDLLELFLPEAA